MSKASSAVARRQAPLRRTFKEDPPQAIIEKRVRTVDAPTTDPWHGTVVTDRTPQESWRYGIDSKVGGFDDLPNPGHVLCAALAGCMDSTLRMIADHLGVDIRHLEVDVSGDVDVRGCLAVEPAVRPGFQQLRCEIRLTPEPGTDNRRVQVLLDQAQNLCVTLDTLRHGVPVDVSSHVDLSPDVVSREW